MYILLESTYEPISTVRIYDIDTMGAVKTEREAREWRNANIEYREYKYVRID